jgi:hypothetical protein
LAETVDEDARRKRDLADALLEGADASARLSQEDLIDLIRSGE